MHNQAVKALKWWHFVRHYRAGAVLARVAHGLLGRTAARFPGIIRPQEVAGCAFANAGLGAFTRSWIPTADRFDGIDKLAYGVFETKGARADFGSVEAMDWTPRFKDKPELSNWAYDFGFFSYAPLLVARDPRGGVELLARMLATLERRHALGTGKMPHFVWNPIVVALRTLGLVAAGRLAFEAGVSSKEGGLVAIARHIAYCSAYLDRFAERYLGYNHAAFALTALCVADVAVLGAARGPALLRDAVDSIDSQVLPDGLQGELTATYHIHVLMLARALDALGCAAEVDADRLRGIIARMTEALDVLVHPDGEIALFNDCAQADSVPPKAVGWHPRAAGVRRTILVDAGYAKLATPRATAIFDAGRMGPDDVIGHAHGDFLSFELSASGERLITDPGVFSYAFGPLRDRTRSAATHNGPGYVGLEPAEFFGAWRVGRRGAAHLLDDAFLPGARALEVAGWCDGYDRFGGRVLRYLGLSEAGDLTVVDAWCGGDGLIPELRFLVPGTWAVEKATERGVRLLHPNGAIVAMTASDFIRKGPLPSEWRPQGAMVRYEASEIRFVPDCTRPLEEVYVNAIHIGTELGGGLPSDSARIMASVVSHAREAGILSPRSAS